MDYGAFYKDAEGERYVLCICQLMEKDAPISVRIMKTSLGKSLECKWDPYRVFRTLEAIVSVSDIISISDLPVNLVEEILYRVPLKSMRAVRLTCKDWDTLSKNRSFSKMHIGKLRAVKEGESL
ncbi:hypothetical protein YC2023_058694 [Brassica napus]